jgi:hypothetical protein
MQGDIARYHAGGQSPVLSRHACLPALRLEVLCPFRFLPSGFRLQVFVPANEKSHLTVASFHSGAGSG